MLSFSLPFYFLQSSCVFVDLSEFVYFSVYFQNTYIYYLYAQNGMVIKAELWLTSYGHDTGQQ